MHWTQNHKDIKQENSPVMETVQSPQKKRLITKSSLALTTSDSIPPRNLLIVYAKFWLLETKPKTFEQTQSLSHYTYIYATLSVRKQYIITTESTAVVAGRSSAPCHLNIKIITWKLHHNWWQWSTSHAVTITVVQKIINYSIYCCWPASNAAIDQYHLAAGPTAANLQ